MTNNSNQPQASPSQAQAKRTALLQAIKDSRRQLVLAKIEIAALQRDLDHSQHMSSLWKQAAKGWRQAAIEQLSDPPQDTTPEPQVQLEPILCTKMSADAWQTINQRVRDWYASRREITHHAAKSRITE